MFACRMSNAIIVQKCFNNCNILNFTKGDNDITVVKPYSHHGFSHTVSNL